MSSEQAKKEKQTHDLKLIIRKVIRLWKLKIWTLGVNLN